MKLTGYPANCASVLERAFGVRFPDAQCTVEKDGSVSLEWGLQSTAPAPSEIIAAELPAAKAARIAAINAECRARLIARFGDAAEQVSRSIGVYGLAEKSALELGIAATIDASNTASDVVTASTTVQEVEAVAVTWPAI